MVLRHCSFEPSYLFFSIICKHKPEVVAAVAEEPVEVPDISKMKLDELKKFAEDNGIDLTGYWYNPNIHPFTEYRARRNCLQEYAKTIGLPLLVRDDYGLRPFVRAVADDIAHGRSVARHRQV